ncbi:MAG: DinB family protein [Chloroflexi bacterium]|nr:MAG: DinB family protein [Chloroflexota bacterium]
MTPRIVSVDLRERFDALEASRVALLNRLAGLDPRRWVQAPRPGSWSLGEIAHHLVLAEEEVLRQLREPEADFGRRQTLRDRFGRALVGWIFRRGIHVKTPMRSMVPTPGRSLEEIRHAWGSVRSELASYLTTLHEGERTRVIFRHPVAGRMSIMQTLELIRAHFDDYLRQVAQTIDALADTPPPPRAIATGRTLKKREVEL